MNVDKRRFVIYLCKKSLARLFKTKLTAHLVSLHFFQCVFNCIVIPDYFFFFLQITQSSSCRTCFHFSVLCSEVRRRSGLCCCDDLHVCHDSKNIPKQCGNCFGERRQVLCNRHVVFRHGNHEKTNKKKSIIVPDVLYVPFLPVPWKINNLSLFRVVWRFSQDLVLFWDRRSEGGCTSHLDMKSLLCFLDVSYWLWFLSTYTSCQPLVVVGDFSILFVHIQSF